MFTTGKERERGGGRKVGGEEKGTERKKTRGKGEGAIMPVGM